jgi:hypothetical protein
MQPTHTPATWPDAPATSRHLDAARRAAEANRRFFDLRAAGYNGPIDQDGYPVAELAIPEPSATDPVAATPAVILRGAGLYLVRHGWCQGDAFADPEAAFPAACALGAIRMAVFGTPAISDDTAASCELAAAVGVLTDHLVRQLGVPDAEDAITSRCGIGLEQIVADWNDDPARIVPHVIAALHGAADAWDKAHVGNADYRRRPGTGNECPLCEWDCDCANGLPCVYCVADAEDSSGQSLVDGVE